MEEVKVRKALKGLLKDRIFNKWRSEIWVVGAVLTHYTFPKHSLNPYLMSGTIVDPGNRKRNKTFLFPEQAGQLQQKLPGGSAV